MGIFIAILIYLLIGGFLAGWLSNDAKDEEQTPLIGVCLLAWPLVIVLILGRALRKLLYPAREWLAKYGEKK